MPPAATDELPCSFNGLPEGAAYHLKLAGLNYSLDTIAEQHLAAATALAPRHLAVLAGHYRYLFYKGRLNEALTQLNLCLSEVAAQGHLPADWRSARIGDADFGDYSALWARFYVFALKAYGYLNLRLGRLEEGRVALNKLLELDPTDKVGAGLLLKVLDRQGRDDDE